MSDFDKLSYIAESLINGQPKQAKELIRKLNRMQRYDLITCGVLDDMQKDRVIMWIVTGELFD